MTQTSVYPAPPGELALDSRHEGDNVTLIVRGEIDIASAPELEQHLHDAESALPGRIVLDLAALDFIDSTGIHLLIHAQQRADSNGHQLILTNVPAQAQRLFSLTKLNSRLNIQ